jgi:hypothetical protein
LGGRGRGDARLHADGYAVTLRVALNGSAWLQLNLCTTTAGASVWIYSIKLTLSEQQR